MSEERDKTEEKVATDSLSSSSQIPQEVVSFQPEADLITDIERSQEWERAKSSAMKTLAKAKSRGGRKWRREDLYQRGTLDPG